MPENIACTLEVTTDGKTRTITLDDKVVTFGRSRKNTVTLREDGKVSSQHCQVVRQKDSWMLIDNGSKNKTFLNGSAVSVAALKHGDTFKIGETSVSFKVGAPQALDPKEAEKLLLGEKPSSNQVAGEAIAAALAQPAPEPRAARKSSGVRDAVKIERGSKGVSIPALACFFVAGIISGVTLLYSIDGRDHGKKVVAKAEEKAKGLVQNVKDVVAPTAEELKSQAALNAVAEIKTRMGDLRQVIEKSADKDTILKSLTDLRASLASSRELDQVRGEFDELKKTVQSMNGDVAWLKGEFDALGKTYFNQQDVVVAPNDKPVAPVDAPKDPPVVAVKDTPKDPVVVPPPPVDTPKPADEPVVVKKDAPPPPPAVGEEPDPAKPPADSKDVKVDPGTGTTTEPVDDPNRPPTQFMGMQTKMRHVIFVMDVTGSMEDPASVTPSEFSGPPEVKIGAELKRTLDKFDRKDVKTKLDAAKYELSHTIAYLHPDVEFTVIFYSFSPVPWQKRFMQASDKNKVDAIKRIKTTSAWGGTNIFDALECAFQVVDDAKKAMKKPAPAAKPGEKAKADFAIFLVTDGKHNTGRFQNDPDEFLKEIRKINADDRVLINTIGVGQPGVGVDPPDPVFLSRLASENGGEGKMVK